MTTALLNVGIKTESAKVALKELRAELAQGVKVAVAIDPTSIDQSIQGYLRQRTFKVSVNGTKLRQEVADSIEFGITDAFKRQRTLLWNQAAFRGGMNAAVEAVFNARRRIAIDQEGLGSQVFGAVTAALAKPFKVNIDTAALAADLRAAGAAGIVAAPAGAAGAGVDQAALLRTVGTRVEAALVSPLDRLGKAAEQVAAVAAQVVRVGRSVDASGTNNKRAKVGGSVLDPETGLRTSFSQSLEGADLTAAERNVREAASAQLGAKAEAEKLRLMQQSANETFRVRRRLADQEAAERAAETRQEQAEEANKQRLMQQSANETYRVRRRLAAQERAEALAAQRTAQREQAAVESDTRKIMEQSSTETFRVRRRLAAQEAAERRAEERREQAAEAANQRLLQQSANETFRVRRRLAAQELAARRAEMKALADAAEFAQGDQYNAKGRRVLRAAAIQGSGRFSDDEVRGFVGNDSVLAAVGQLDSYRKASTAAADTSGRDMKKAGDEVKRTADHTRDLHRVTRDAHDAARGLAGSLGAIWLTWGQVVPLAVGAGIGATLRNAFVAGKDLQYQLEFVKVLSDGTAVSFDQLGKAAVGAMARPTEAAEGLRGLAQNGLSAAEALKALPEVMNLATAGEMALQEAALGATGVMAAFNMQVSEIGTVGDVFAKAASESNTSVTAMVEAMKQASTVADQYNVSLEETAASLAIMAKRNIEGSAAGTAFRNMMVELASPTEQAKQALKMLGVETFDATGKLKPYTQVLREIRDTTLLLNEQSRINLLNTIFGERGGKAANSIITDLDQFTAILDDLQHKSEGFAASVTEALGETTAGQVKKLMAEFELQSTRAFNEANGSVNGLIETMRQFVNSPEFVTGIQALVANIAALTQSAIEHKGVIVGAIEVYAAYRIATAISTSTLMQWTAAKVAATVQSRAMTAAQVTEAAAAHGVAAAQTAAAAASRTAAVWSGIATGGLSILLGVASAAALEWLVFADHTDKAARAQEEFGRKVKHEISTLREHAEQLEADIEQLRERNRLMREGMGLDEANKLAAARQAGPSNENQVSVLRQIEELNTKIAAKEAEIEQKRGGRSTGAQVGKARGELRELLEQRTNLNSVMEDMATREAEKARVAADKLVKHDEEAFGRRLSSARSFNERLAEINSKSGGKTKTEDLRLPTDDASLNDPGFDKRLKEAEEALNARLQSKMVQSRSAQAESDRLENARTQQLAQQAKQREDILKQEARAYRDLELARFDPSRFGQEIAALINEQTERRYTAELIQIEEQAVASLEARKAGQKGSEVVRIQTEIDARKHSIAMMRSELEARSAIERAKVATERDKEQERDDAMLAARAAKDEAGLDSVDRKSQVKFVSKEQSAREAAEAAVRAEYESDILAVRSRVASVDRQIADLVENQLLSSSDQLDDSTALLEAAEARRSRELAVLEALEAQADASARRRGDQAAGGVAWSQSAEAGWKRFWKDYEEGASSAAENVYSIMQSTTRGMEDLVSQFVLTGKFKWREFAAGVAAEAAKVMANKAVMSLLNMFIGMFGGGGWSAYDTGGYGVTSGGTGLADYGLGGGRAVGGPMSAGKDYIVGERGIERVRMYPGGGGYVTPNEDLYRSTGGAAAVVSSEQTNVNVYVTVNNDGTSDTKVTGDAEARKIGERMAAVARQVIAEEKRTGGQLEKAA